MNEKLKGEEIVALDLFIEETKVFLLKFVYQTMKETFCDKGKCQLVDNKGQKICVICFKKEV